MNKHIVETTKPHDTWKTYEYAKNNEPCECIPCTIAKHFAKRAEKQLEEMILLDQPFVDITPEQKIVLDNKLKAKQYFEKYYLGDWGKEWD